MILALFNMDAREDAAMEELIKKALEEKKMTQKELAEKLYVTPQAVSKWLTGESRPSQDNVERIYEILGIDLTKEVVAKRHLNKKCMKETNIEDLNTFEKAKKEAISILDELGFASKYSHSVYTLCNWLLCSVIGLVYHKYINNHDKEVTFDYGDIYFELEDYIKREVSYDKPGLYENDLEYDFYIMGMDLFESFGDDKLLNLDYGHEVMSCWERFKTAVIKDNSSPVYNELLVAISELIDSAY